MGKNAKLLLSFTQYCMENPEQRFWQALRNWANESDPEASFIYKSAVPPYDFPPEVQKALKDTFYE